LLSVLQAAAALMSLFAVVRVLRADLVRVVCFAQRLWYEADRVTRSNQAEHVVEWPTARRQGLEELGKREQRAAVFDQLDQRVSGDGS
jgi:hypothetical protein